MINKKGFIATSLLYSFFLVFCALLLALIGTFMHNRVLLNSVVDNIKNELSETGKKTIASAEIGSYVKIPVFSTGVTINTENLNWVVTSRNTTNKTVTLVSDNVVVMSNKYQNITVMQEELNKYYNLYTAGTATLNYLTYLTKAQITSFESEPEINLRKALLSAGTEYFYYDPGTASFYLYKYTCNINNVCSVEKNQKINAGDIKYYGLRFVMVISDNTPISTGIGVAYDPYDVLYYVHQTDKGDVLKLHYDNINHNGNLGFKTSANVITDLSGNNLNGILDSGTFTNNINNGLTISASRTINTNLNIHQIISNTNGYTIEFRVLNYIQLSSFPNYLNNFILLTNNATLKLSNNSYATNKTAGSFNTFSVVKKPGSTYLSVYINGELISSSITVSNLPSLANNILYVGGSPYPETFKSIRVYNVALTELEIIHNYNVDERWRIV